MTATVAVAIFVVGIGVVCWLLLETFSQLFRAMCQLYSTVGEVVVWLAVAAWRVGWWVWRLWLGDYPNQQTQSKRGSPVSVGAVAQGQANPNLLERQIHYQLELLERSLDDQRRLLEQWITGRTSFWREFEQGFASTFRLTIIVAVFVICWGLSR